MGPLFQNYLWINKVEQGGISFSNNNEILSCQMSREGIIQVPQQKHQQMFIYFNINLHNRYIAAYLGYPPWVYEFICA